MNKQERTEIKRKGKKLYWIAYGLALFGILSLVLAFSVKPLADFLRAGFEHESFAVNILSVAALIFPILVPMFVGLIVGAYASQTYNKLYQWRREINGQRNRFQMKRFWEAVRANDYELAMDIYNTDGLIWGSERVLCNGILMGIATQQPIDVEWSKKVDERMESYL